MIIIRENLVDTTFSTKFTYDEMKKEEDKDYDQKCFCAYSCLISSIPPKLEMYLKCLTLSVFVLIMLTKR